MTIALFEDMTERCLMIKRKEESISEGERAGNGIQKKESDTSFLTYYIAEGLT